MEMRQQLSHHNWTIIVVNNGRNRHHWLACLSTYFFPRVAVVMGFFFFSFFLSVVWKYLKYIYFSLESISNIFILVWKVSQIYLF
jgi:hypothetical protein